MKFSMRKVSVLLADGFEEIEALTVVDLLRRARIYVDTISLTDDYTVRGSHGVPVQTEDLFAEVDFSESDMIVLPGGMPGAENLREHEGVRQVVTQMYEDGRYIAAICAAPTVLADWGLLEGKHATCYPSREKDLKAVGAFITKKAVTVDDTIITSQGVGTAIDFALKLIEILVDEATAVAIGESIVYQ